MLPWSTSPTLEFWLAWFCASLLQAIKLMDTAILVYAEDSFAPALCNPRLLSFSDIFLNSPWVLWERWYRCLFCGLSLNWNLLSVYWPAVGFCINTHLVNKEKSLLCLIVAPIYGYRDTDLEGSIVNTVFTYQNNSSGFTPMINHMFLASLKILGMHFLLFSRPEDNPQVVGCLPNICIVIAQLGKP